MENYTPNVDKMYTYLTAFLRGAGMTESIKALSFARQKHSGQNRKNGIPYIAHPLSMACYAAALGIKDDNIMATILLHDVCEITQKRILSNFGKEGIFQFFAEVAYYTKSDSCWFVENFYNPKIVQEEKYRGAIKTLEKKLNEIEITPPSICTVSEAIIRNKEIQEKIRNAKLKEEERLEKERQKVEKLAKENENLEKIRIENKRIELFLKEYTELLCTADIGDIKSKIDELSLDCEEMKSIIDFCKDTGTYKIQYYRQFYVFMYARNIKLNNVPLDLAFNSISDIIKLNDFIKMANLDSSFCKQMKRTISLYKKWLHKEQVEN